ncbi:MAG: CPBP family intramembrane metalloprotease [Candidatus Omnitrophica bacterium]|nr:CPBP family intramembrane metalloprotease [Candidatus Omnitrophota bacterium]
MKNILSYRLILIFACIFLPIFFLILGIYGSFLFTFSIPILWQIGIKKKSLSSLGINKKISLFSFSFGLMSGILFGLLGIAILRTLGIRGYLLTGREIILGFSLKKELGYSLLSRNRFIFFLYCSFLVGLGEELFWRGFIQQRIKNYFNKDFSIWLTSIIFSLVHFYLFFVIGSFFITSLMLIAIFLLGLFWGYVFERYKNIFLNAFSHGISAFIFWSYFFRRSRFGF